MRSEMNSKLVGHADLSVEDVDAVAYEDRTPHMGGANGCQFPESLAGKYKDAWVVGTGATACVWIAQSGGDSVAVKVAKGSGNVAEWQKECREMKQLRTDACSAGAKAQLLAEMYLPTCLEVGEAGPVSYYVMQAAGKHGIKSFAKSIKDDVVLQKSIFAQTVAGVYSMHGIGWTHNDLHGENIVVDDNNFVGLIDFGEIKGHHRGLGKKHDANNIWRWAAAVADCPEGAQYPTLMKSFFSQKNKDELTGRSKELLACLESKWQPGQEFLTAFELVLTNTIKIAEDQEIEQLYETSFVQQNLPPVTSIYPWDGEGCMSAADLDAARSTFTTTTIPTTATTTTTIATTTTTTITTTTTTTTTMTTTTSTTVATTTEAMDDLPAEEAAEDEEVVPVEDVGAEPVSTADMAPVMEGVQVENVEEESQEQEIEEAEATAAPTFQDEDDVEDQPEEDNDDKDDGDDKQEEEEPEVVQGDVDAESTSQEGVKVDVASAPDVDIEADDREQEAEEEKPTVAPTQQDNVDDQVEAVASEQKVEEYADETRGEEDDSGSGSVSAEGSEDGNPDDSNSDSTSAEEEAESVENNDEEVEQDKSDVLVTDASVKKSAACFANPVSFGLIITILVAFRH